MTPIALEPGFNAITFAAGELIIFQWAREMRPPRHLLYPLQARLKRATEC